MSIIKLSRILIVAVLASSAMMAADQPVYKGKLSPELSLGKEFVMAAGKASAEIVATLPTAPAEGDEVLTTKLAGIPVVLIVPGKGDKYFYFDVNCNGKFEESERMSFPGAGKLELKLPAVGIFPPIPMILSYYETPKRIRQSEQDGTKPPAPSGKPQVERIFRVQLASIATGTVDIGGQKTLVQYNATFLAVSKKMDLRSLGLDCNGDGKIDTTGNVEMARANGDEPMVFRVGTHYVTPKSVDVNTGEIIMESRPAAEYKRIEMLVGGTIPDFAFKDFNGKAHQFAEFRGKYVLLDFWGTW